MLSNLSPFWQPTYDQRRIAAWKAINTPLSSNEYRYPNSSWAGYGFSSTSPATPKMEAVPSTSSFQNNVGVNTIFFILP